MIEKFAAVIRDSRAPVVRDPRLLLEESGPVKIYYAPFEYTNPQARLVLVGITPGPTQMLTSLNEARRALLGGKSGPGAVRDAKMAGGFSGEPMRSNLIKQLNHWGFQDWLGLSDAAELFSSARHFIQTTSLLRFPVFVDEDDYRGTPDMTRHPLLRSYLLEHFVAEVRALKGAVFVGLGPQVQTVLERLARDGVIGKDRVIGGMLHPSGNCTYRITYLTGDRRGPVPHATNPAPYDRGREMFRTSYLGR